LKEAVVDASVAVKWVVPEDHSDTATRLLTERFKLYAPGHWLAEATTVLWAKSAVNKALTRPQAEAAIKLLTDVVIDETPVRSLLHSAVDLAFVLQLTVYDTLYLALAVRLAIPLVTADRKLFSKAQGDLRYKGLVVWIGDLKTSQRHDR
jgi:predicted nucleic acid-binding protein